MNTLYLIIVLGACAFIALVLAINSHINRVQKERDWVKRCKAHYVAAGVDEAFAADCAESCLESVDYDLSESPEDAAADDMSYWTAD